MARKVLLVGLLALWALGEARAQGTGREIDLGTKQGKLGYEQSDELIIEGPGGGGPGGGGPGGGGPGGGPGGGGGRFDSPDSQIGSAFEDPSEAGAGGEGKEGAAGSGEGAETLEGGSDDFDIGEGAAAAAGEIFKGLLGDQ